MCSDSVQKDFKELKHDGNLAFERWFVCVASVYGLVTCLVVGIAAFLMVSAQPIKSTGYSTVPRRSGRLKSWPQFMRQNWLSNRLFKSLDDIVDHCCYGWNTLIDQQWKDHVHRPPRLGNQRSVVVRFSIRRVLTS